MRCCLSWRCVWVRMLLSRWLWRGTKMSTSSVVLLVLLLHEAPYFGGQANFGCCWWKFLSSSLYESRMSDNKNQDVSEFGLSSCSARYSNLCLILWTSKILLNLRGFSPASVSWGSTCHTCDSSPSAHLHWTHIRADYIIWVWLDVSPWWTASRMEQFLLVEAIWFPVHVYK